MKLDDIANRTIAHDIRGMLSSVLIAAEQLSNHPDPAVVRQASRIGKAVDLVVELCTQEMLSPVPEQARSRMTMEKTACLLNQTLGLVDFAYGRREPVLRVECHVPEKVDFVCDAVSLARIVFNLAQNSARAIVEHGGSAIAVHVRQSSEHVIVDVIDDGPGLPDDVLSYLLPRLGQYPVSEGSMGYGILSAMRLAWDMGGQLKLERSGADGTHFAIELPRVRNQPCVRRPDLERLSESPPVFPASSGPRDLVEP